MVIVLHKKLLANRKLVFPQGHGFLRSLPVMWSWIWVKKWSVAAYCLMTALRVATQQMSFSHLGAKQSQHAISVFHALCAHSIIHQLRCSGSTFNIAKFRCLLFVLIYPQNMLNDSCVLCDRCWHSPYELMSHKSIDLVDSKSVVYVNENSGLHQ